MSVNISKGIKLYTFCDRSPANCSIKSSEQKPSLNTQDILFCNDSSSKQFRSIKYQTASEAIFSAKKSMNTQPICLKFNQDQITNNVQSTTKGPSILTLKNQSMKYCPNKENNCRRMINETKSHFKNNKSSKRLKLNMNKITLQPSKPKVHRFPEEKQKQINVNKLAIELKSKQTVNNLKHSSLHLSKSTLQNTSISPQAQLLLHLKESQHKNESSNDAPLFVAKQELRRFASIFAIQKYQLENQISQLKNILYLTQSKLKSSKAQINKLKIKQKELINKLLKCQKNNSQFISIQSQNQIINLQNPIQNQKQGLKQPKATIFNQIGFKQNTETLYTQPKISSNLPYWHSSKQNLNFKSKKSKSPLNKNISQKLITKTNYLRFRSLSNKRNITLKQLNFPKKCFLSQDKHNYQLSLRQKKQFQLAQKQSKKSFGDVSQQNKIYLLNSNVNQNSKEFNKSQKQKYSTFQVPKKSLEMLQINQKPLKFGKIQEQLQISNLVIDYQQLYCELCLKYDDILLQNIKLHAFCHKLECSLKQNSYLHSQNEKNTKITSTVSQCLQKQKLKKYKISLFGQNYIPTLSIDQKQIQNKINCYSIPHFSKDFESQSDKNCIFPQSLCSKGYQTNQINNKDQSSQFQTDSSYFCKAINALRSINHDSSKSMIEKYTVTPTYCLQMLQNQHSLILDYQNKSLSNQNLLKTENTDLQPKQIQANSKIEPNSKIEINSRMLNNQNISNLQNLHKVSADYRQKNKKVQQFTQIDNSYQKHKRHKKTE